MDIPWGTSQCRFSVGSVNNLRRRHVPLFGTVWVLSEMSSSAARAAGGEGAPSKVGAENPAMSTSAGSTP